MLFQVPGIVSKFSERKKNYKAEILRTASDGWLHYLLKEVFISYLKII